MGTLFLAARLNPRQAVLGVAELGQFQPQAVHQREIQAAQLAFVVARWQVVQRATGLQLTAQPACGETAGKQK